VNEIASGRAAPNLGVPGYRGRPEYPRSTPRNVWLSIDVEKRASTDVESLSLEIQGFSERSRRRWKLSDFVGRGEWCRKEDSNP
jgi:hypothetical protein